MGIMDLTNIIFLIQLSAITIGISANNNLLISKHDNILQMIISFHRHHRTEHIIFHVDQKSWKNHLQYKFQRIQKDIGGYISIIINQNPMLFLA